MKSKPRDLTLKEYLTKIERKGIIDELRFHGGNVAAAARSAGYPLRTFFTRIKNHEIDVDAYRQKSA